MIELNCVYVAVFVGVCASSKLTVSLVSCFRVHVGDFCLVRVRVCYENITERFRA